MLQKVTILAFLVCVLIAATSCQLTFKSGHCPLKSSIKSCSPRCMSDYQCSFNEKCCPNVCGHSSCASASAISTGNGYKGSDDSPVYCAGVKCTRYEKCQFDRSTKREKCVRA